MAGSSGLLAHGEAVALDLDDWLAAFDKTPIDPQSPRELPWVAGGLLIASLLAELGDTGIGFGVATHVLAGSMFAAACFVALVAWPAGFALVVGLRNHFATDKARWLGCAVRWCAFVLVSGIAYLAGQQRQWELAVYALVGQVLVLVEAFLHLLTCRASLVDRLPVDSMAWMRRATSLFRAQIVTATISFTALLWPDRSLASADGWTIIGVLAAVLIPVLTYTNHQLGSIEQWKRDLLVVLDGGMRPPSSPLAEETLGLVLLRLETLIVTGPAAVGPAVEPAIRRVVIALAVSLRDDRISRDPWSPRLTSAAADKLAQVPRHERLGMALELMSLLRARLLYGSKQGRA